MKWAWWIARLNLFQAFHTAQTLKTAGCVSSSRPLLENVKESLFVCCAFPIKKDILQCDIQDKLKHRIALPSDRLIDLWAPFFSGDDWTSLCQCWCNLNGEFGSSTQFACLCFAAWHVTEEMLFPLPSHHAHHDCLNIHQHWFHLCSKWKSWGEKDQNQSIFTLFFKSKSPQQHLWVAKLIKDN